jgi:hypothetical protein
MIKGRPARGDRRDGVGLGAAYDDALRTAILRLQHDPWSFGELIGDLQHMQLKIQVAVVRPLLVEFAIHEEKPLVFIKRILFIP